MVAMILIIVMAAWLAVLMFYHMPRMTSRMVKKINDVKNDCAAEVRVVSSEALLYIALMRRYAITKKSIMLTKKSINDGYCSLDEVRHYLSILQNTKRSLKIIMWRTYKKVRDCKHAD
jgi:hypothetical protein